MSRVLPILFNTEMVREIPDGRKTVTRRVVKGDIDAILHSPYHAEHPEIPDNRLIEMLCKMPYRPGDILYVRETWRNVEKDIDIKSIVKKDDITDIAKWRPSIHMPKEAARIWLRVTNVRVERLQECGNGWCLEIEKEGIITPQSPILYVSDDAFHEALREEFKKVWNSTIKKSDLARYGWYANPWVWVIEFERTEPEQ